MLIIHSSVVLVTRRHDKRVLMLRRRPDDRSYPHKWCLPGGRCDEGETYAETARREVLEETDMDVPALHHLLDGESVLERRERTYIIHAFQAEPPCAYVRLSDEHDDFVWVTIDEALQLDLAGPFTRKVLEAAK